MPPKNSAAQTHKLINRPIFRYLARLRGQGVGGSNTVTPTRGRFVKWTSTTERADIEEFTFVGKLAVIVNSFPRNFDAEAVRNRSLELEINPGVSETKELLTEAAKDRARFPNRKIVKIVLKKIVDNLTEENLAKVSYRTLQKAYEVAIHNPDSFEKMAHKVFSLSKPMAENPLKAIDDLHRSKLKVKDQLKEFERLTGFKRRSFFKYRKQLGIQDE